jgi:hypothetical protein
MHKHYRGQVKQMKRQLNERGFASIVVALVLILVLALITIGFAQLARREQKNALNRQLSDAAFYAAESGLNDAKKNLANITSIPGFNNKDCLNAMPSASAYFKSDIDQATGASYTCVRVDTEPPTLFWNNVEPNTGRHISFSVDDPNGLQSLTVSWSRESTPSIPRSDGKLDTLANWKAAHHPAVLQVSITPLASTFNRQDLIDKTFTTYLYPSAGGAGSGTAHYTAYATDPSQSAQITRAKDCDSDPSTFSPCVVIDNLPAGSATYAVHIVNYYDKSTITIGNGIGQNGLKQHFKDGQAAIDATGRARYVLKRIQTRAPIQQDDTDAKDAIEGQSICKRIIAYPASSGVSTDFDTPSGYAGPPSGPCELDVQR